MVINAAGNVGIGVSAPLAKLDARSGVSSSTTSWVSGAFGGTETTSSRVVIGNLLGKATVGAHASDLNSWADLYLNDPTFPVIVKTDGKFGIGVTDPDARLHIEEPASISATTRLFHTETGFTGGSRGHFEIIEEKVGSGTAWSDFTCRLQRRVDTTVQGYIDFNPSGSTGDYGIALGNSGGGGPGEIMRIDGLNGRVGIGTASPYSTLDTYSGGITQRHTGDITPWRSTGYVSAPNAGINLGQTGYAITGGAAMYWNIAMWSNHNLHFASRGLHAAHVVGDTNVATRMNFTGQHRTFIKDVSFTQAIDLEGLIVSADQNKYIKMSGGIEAGSNAITTNESLPIVSISTKVNDKKCFGVISTSEDPETREEAYGRFVSTIQKENGDTRVYINSVGEGALWVTNINGSLESGDYITTSNVAGYGQKQDGAGLMNYTVAKITMDCDFSPVTQPIQNIKKELQDVNYWFKMRYDTITEAEFSNCTSESRRTVTGTVYTDENGEINTEQYNSLEPDVQSTYTELTRTIYQSVERESFKTEKDGYEHEVRNESVNVLDEHEQIQFEDDPTETEKAYKIRYLDANGVITDEANAVHTAAFVGCTYHCG
jgi:hypothetical protein